LSGKNIRFRQSTIFHKNDGARIAKIARPYIGIIIFIFIALFYNYCEGPAEKKSNLIEKKLYKKAKNSLAIRMKIYCLIAPFLILV